MGVDAGNTSTSWNHTFTMRIRKPWVLEIYSGICSCPIKSSNGCFAVQNPLVLAVIGQRTKEHSRINFSAHSFLILTVTHQSVTHNTMAVGLSSRLFLGRGVPNGMIYKQHAPLIKILTSKQKCKLM